MQRIAYTVGALLLTMSVTNAFADAAVDQDGAAVADTAPVASLYMSPTSEPAAQDAPVAAKPAARIDAATDIDAAVEREAAVASDTPVDAPAAIEASTDVDTPEPADSPPPSQADTPALAGQMEGIKRDLVELKRDLAVLEEDLLYPASSQVAVFLSMDVGEFFALDSVTLKLNGKDVTHYLYTEKQTDALFRGGVQRLYVGNVKQGENQLTAFFIGRGPEGRDYSRAATVTFEKSFEPSFVELKISDSTAKYQPEFVATVSP